VGRRRLRASIAVAFALARGGDRVRRRAIWLGVGAALGAGASVWVRRRVELVAEQVRSGDVTSHMVAVAKRTAKHGARRVRRAVQAGRDDARQREDQLWQELEVRARAR
jgi:hypothetical protein